MATREWFVMNAQQTKLALESPPLFAVKKDDDKDHTCDTGEEPYALVGSPVFNPLEDYKREVVSIIDEYFSSGDVEVAASDLMDLGLSEYHPYFVKRLVSMAMDRGNKEKEKASVLLSRLYALVVSPDQIRVGFIRLLESVGDLALDIPDAVNVILVSENSYLSAPHHAELVETKWGGSTHITVEETKRKISEFLNEYVENGDTREACRCIRELGVSFFHHEIVKSGLVLVMESRTSEPLILKLLKEATEEGLISSSQMAKGFSRVADSLDDLSLDIPSAKTLFESIVPKAIIGGWLDEDSFKERSDQNGGSENLRRFKKDAVTIIQEYFLSDDIPELIRSLEDLGLPEYNPVFLKKLITLAMDRKNKEKEMASVFLASLHMEMFSTEDFINGFIMLLESAEDTALDILAASDELALFLARAVIDDVLAPLNLEEISNSLPPKSTGSETIRSARSLISARHAGERLLRSWGGGTGWAVEDAKDKIWKLLEEYEVGGVISEACRCIRDLGMPFFNHEVVKKALVMAMEKKNDRMLNLLQECFAEGIITTNQMTKGFGRVKDSLDDLSLDIPNAEEKFNSYVAHAEENGWLHRDFGCSTDS
ncbi:Armadillo-type fold [Arabidopsis suecica]|uniref:Armadillo-type fold n=1 Tax=Arabidopsis suecica TaxID=45249 RepID=A0A8T2FQR1_ARASU|nr:Armadillo-type fold [Arabidopsis suecica]